MIPLALTLPTISRSLGGGTTYQRVACQTEDGQWFDFNQDDLKRLSCGIHLPPGFEELMRKLYKELVLPDVVARRLMRSS